MAQVSPTVPITPPPPVDVTKYFAKPGDTFDAYEKSQGFPQTPKPTPTPSPSPTPAPTAQSATKTITDSLGNTYQVDNSGQIVQGSSTGQYQVGHNVANYQDAQDQVTSQTTGKSLDQVALERNNAATQAEADRVHQQLLGYENGSIPLTAGEQAQVDALKASFKQLIDAQILTNTGAQGTGNIRGYQKGAAEYDPTFQAKTIGSIVQAGVNKVADLNIKMASAVAQLTQSFKDNDILAVKNAWDTYNNAAKDRQAQLQKNIENAQKAVKDAQDRADEQQKRQDALDKENRDRQDDIVQSINDIAQDAAKNNAPASIREAINNAQSVGEAIAAAKGFLQTATGTLGDYLQYSRDAEAKGLTPKDYATFKDEQDAKASKLKASEAYSSAYNSAAGKAAAEAKYGSSSGNDTVNNLAQQLVSGNLAPSELSKRATGTISYNAVLKAADDYSLATTGKHFNIATADRDYKFAQRPQTQDTLNYLKSLTGTADQSGNISGGNLDELKDISNSINRTKFPALNNAQQWASLATGDVKYAQFQAVATEVADQVAKILQGGTGGGGTSDAKLQQAVNLFNTGFTKDQLNGVIESLKPLLTNRAKSMIGDNAYLKDYADDLGIETGISSPSKQVDSYVKANPGQAETIAKLYEVPGATDQDVLDYISQLHK